MARDEKKRQKKLARKTAKRKAKQASARAVHSATDPARDAETALSSPLHECLVPGDLFNSGIGNILVSRRMPDGRVALSVFLLDVFCLGVKDVFSLVMTASEYLQKMEEIRRGAAFTSVEPAFARKLIEGAEEYARDLGFSPQPKYHSAMKMFGEVDTADCLTQFEFGKDGKPLFISGPDDTQARCMRIIETLTKRCGPGGFGYMIGVNSGI
ncbi:MAG TPA: hypothetical protein VK435_11860 [Thermodesulfovibrionales bacterium]|nr:hypothetical protein [Thermodesulfovibrionales bacterium]